MIEERVGSELPPGAGGRGFEFPTPVQEAVLRPELEGVISGSLQTGSRQDGRVRPRRVRSSLGSTGDTGSDGNEKGVDQRARPRAIVVVPTRAGSRSRSRRSSRGSTPVCPRCLSHRRGHRRRWLPRRAARFRAKPAIIVGTPGRLLDHLKRAPSTLPPTRAPSSTKRTMLDLGRTRETSRRSSGSRRKGAGPLLVSRDVPARGEALADRV